MAELFEQLRVIENQNRAALEIGYTIEAINDVYKEWKKTKRRRNAVNIVTTSVNKLATINPVTLEHVHETAKLKLATVLMRCMDLPPWMDAETKRITYRRLYPLLDAMQSYNPNTGTNGSLREVIMSRLSASVCRACDPELDKNTYVAYEPQVTTRYLRFIFGDEIPTNISKMQCLSLPEDFDILINTLKINHTKACERYNQQS